MLRANAPQVELTGGTSTWLHELHARSVRRRTCSSERILGWPVRRWCGGGNGGCGAVGLGTLLGPEGTNLGGLLLASAGWGGRCWFALMGRDRSVEPLLRRCWSVRLRVGGLVGVCGGRRWNRGRGFTRCLRTAQWTRASLVFASRMYCFASGLALGCGWCVCGC